MASVGVVRVSLNEEQTRALLREIPGIYHTQINDVLLMPLVQVLSEWSGQPRVLIDLEGHGREEVLEGADLSRTVGWFTTVYPVVLECGEVTGIGEKLKSIKEQLRAVPNRGLGYGVLRYIRGGEQAGKLEVLPEAELSFNYLGQFDQVLGKESLFRSADEDGGPFQGAEERRRYLLDVLCIVINERLQIEWSYNKRAHDLASIERLAGSYVEALRELIAHCQCCYRRNRNSSISILFLRSRRGFYSIVFIRRSQDSISPKRSFD
jgi:non-ribosomal peptide synthase protein (TIGR01720 family)